MDRAKGFDPGTDIAHTQEYKSRMRAKRTNGVVNAGAQESWDAVVSICVSYMSLAREKSGHDACLF